MMKKITLSILSLISSLGILQIIWGFFNYLFTGDSDGLELSMFIALPILFSTYLLYNLWKNPEYFEKYKISFKIIAYGILISFVLSILEYMREILVIKASGFVGLAAFLIFIFGILLTFIISIISWIVIFFKNK